MTAYINAVAAWLPEKIETTEDLIRENPDWNAARIVSKTGIHSRHLASSGELTSNLAVAAARALMENHHIAADSIDHLIVCTQTPDHLIPSCACRVQHALGMPTRTAAFDINMGCSGYIYGLQVAAALVNAGAARRVLLINADTYSKLLAADDLATRTLFGDGATASLISADPTGAAIGAIVLGTDGAGYDGFVARNSALADDGDQSRRIRMDGPAIFNFTLERVPALVKEFLANNQLEQANIAQFVFHQANAWMLDHLRKKIGIDASRFPLIMGDIGNTVSASIPMVLTSLKDRLKPGDKLVLVGFGVGLSWGISLLTWQ
jgi:3-oxoacyl-[acyl-carrier-protein] synthase-3